MSPSTARFCASCGRTLAEKQRGSEEERRRVTSLFADLSGFTTLAGQVDAEGLVEIVDTVIAGLASIVERYEGHVATFVGDALLALFGAPVAHEDDAARALRTAAEMHEWLAGQSTPPGTPELRLHTGINTGTVVARSFEGGGRTQYDVLGESVILAQRLEALAPSGQTYVGELTRQLTAEQFDFEDLGLREVKGRTDPIRVYRLLGRASRAARIRGRMFGREREMASLLDAFAAAGDRGSRTVHITGPAGSGKTRLLAELREHPAAAPALLVDIVGESNTQAAYQSLAPLFDAALRARYPDHQSTAERLERVSADPQAPGPAEYTSVLVGAPLDDSLDGREAQEIGRQLYAAARAWLADLCARQQLVVVVDNLQWLAPSSADLLHELATSAVTPGALFCLAGRVPPKPRTDDSTVTIALRPLEADDVNRLIGDEIALAPDNRLTSFVLARSEGNPLMARETIRHLRDEDLLDSRHGHARLLAGVDARGVPATLDTMLAARIDSMTQESVQVATAAAAIGIIVPARLLAAVSDQDDETLTLSIGRLADAGFVARQADGDVRFDDPIVRDVLYSRLTTRRRQALHARIADAIDSTVTSPVAAAALLAEHRYLAGDTAGALPWLRRIADRARRVYAHDDAVIALRRAIDSVRSLVPPRADLLSRLLCDLGDLRMELGEYELAEEAYVAGQSAGGDARAYAGIGASLRRRGRYAQAREELEAGLASQPSGDVRLVWGELSAVLSVSGDLDGTLAAARTGLALGVEDDRTAALLLVQIMRAETLLGRFDDARAHVDRAIDILEQARDEAGLCTALRLLGLLQEAVGQLHEAAATSQRGLDLAERIGLVEEIGACLTNLGLVHGALGDHQGAADYYARAAVTFERSDNRAGQATARGNWAYEQFMLGDASEARALGEHALALADEVGNHLTSADIHHTLGLIAESEGDAAEMLEHARAAIREFELAAVPHAAQASRELAQRALDSDA